MAPPGGVLHATNIGTHNASLLGIFSAAQQAAFADEPEKGLLLSFALGLLLVGAIEVGRRVRVRILTRRRAAAETGDNGVCVEP